MSGTVICPECHSQNNAGDKFCEQCGNQLPQTPSTLEPDVRDMGATVMADAGAQQARLYRLGEEGGQEVELGPQAIVGRLETNDVSVNDKSVSREHAKLSRLRDGYVLEDLDSTNGTFVNGHRITEPVLLQPGDAVTFGAVEFGYEMNSAQREGAQSGSAATSTFNAVPPVATPDFQPTFGPAPAGPEPLPPSSPDSSRPLTDMPQFPTQPATSEEAGTMDEAAPVPMTFPPLEPFGAAHQYQQEVAPDVIPAISPMSTPKSNVESEGTSTSSGAETSAPDNHPEPQSNAANENSAGSPAFEALETMKRLSALVGDMATELAQHSADAERLQDAMRSAENAAARQQSLKEVLTDVPEPAVAAHQLSEFQDMLDALINNPRDVELLMKVGQQATGLAAVINEYGQLRRIVGKIASRLDVSLPS